MLIGDGNVGFPGRDQLGRIVGVGRGDDLDLEARSLEIAAALGHQDRRVIRIDEPVEQQRQLLGGVRRARKQQAGRDQQPAMPERTPPRIIVKYLTRATLTPKESPASGFSPTARIFRPRLVLLRTNQLTGTKRKAA